MGDHRDNARDSRYFGFVAAKAIIGRVYTIYWSWDSDNPLAAARARGQVAVR